MRNDMELRHIIDLATRSYNNNQYTFSSFMTIAQMTDFYDIVKELPPCGYTVSGGFEGAQRVIIRFGNERDLGYEEPFPFVCVRVEPLVAKFSEDLTHRDVLGSIMNLGMEREKIGDILIKDNIIWIICLPAMADVIMKDLTRIKHTSVKCHIEETMPKALMPTYVEVQIQAASERIDGVVSKICKLSRNASSQLFLEGKIAVNGRENRNHSYILKENDIVSVRGFGKFRFIGVSGSTRKGNHIITLEKFT